MLIRFLKSWLLAALSIDASLIKTDVDKKKRVAGDQPITWPKAEEASCCAVREYLAALDTARSDEENRDAGVSSDRGSRIVRWQIRPAAR